RPVPGRGHLRGRHRHLFRPPARQRAPGRGHAARGHRPAADGPGGHRPRLGEVFHYVVTGKGDDLTELRTVHDWVIKPKLRTVKGTAEVNSWGGFAKQFQIRIDPNRLDRHKLTLDQVV